MDAQENKIINDGTDTVTASDTDTTEKKSATAKKSSTKKSTTGTKKKTEVKEETTLLLPIEPQEDDSPLFEALPDNAIAFDTAELDITEDEAEKLEAEAIAALPHAESLDSILFDANDDFDSRETTAESTEYESFLADYNQTMAAIFREVTKKEDEIIPEESVENEAVPSSDDSTPIEDAPVTRATTDEEVTPLPADTEIQEVPSVDDVEADEASEETPEQMVMDFGAIPEEREAEERSEDTEEISPEEKTDPDVYDPKKPRRIDSIFDFVELLVFTLAAVFIITSFFFRHSIVKGGSMDNTLNDGEHLILTHLFYTPKRGDIVVFEDREAGVTSPYIKRVIGIEGDTVLVLPDGSVYLNGEKLEEDYVYTDGKDDKPTGTFIVGEGEIFVMGDHRNVSEDSRTFGVVNADSVLGKVVLRFYPLSKFGTVN